MILYQHCGSIKIIKDGLVKNKQRYLFKECNKTFRSGDDREKYPIDEKIKAVKLSTEGMDLRSIERLEFIPTSLLIYWIRSFLKIIREKICSTNIPEDLKEIEILEMDELFTYYQRKAKDPMYGLLAVDRNRNKIIDIRVSRTRECIC